MLKKVIFSCLTISFLSLSATDSGTVSAALYYHVSQEIDEKDVACDLFNRLINELEHEQAPEEIIQAVADQYINFQDGEDIQAKARDLWLKLTQEKRTKNVMAYNQLKENPLVTSKEYRTIKPWILPKDHPMRTRLDAIFMTSRATKDSASFANAGFITFKVQPRSYIRVARHPDIPGYVLKVYLDDELRTKNKKQGWYWFAKRCEGAKRITSLIKNKKIQHFKVASKWIYPLPLTPKPPKGANYDPKSSILIATDMNIVSYEESKAAWLTQMTPAHLNELFTLIAYGKGRSYRPDNIPYSTDGKFAFIDTEYPDAKPEFSTPLEHFSPEMAAYWKKLMTNGGP